MSGRSQRVAVVGGGVAGITAAHLLSQGHHVTLFERNTYVGGHTNTVSIPTGPDAGTPVDTGFIVFNRATYPLFCRLLERLGVEAQDSDMSFAVSCRESGLEYAGTSLRSIFAQPSNVLRPGFLGMLADIFRFNRIGSREADAHSTERETVGQFLSRHRFGVAFRRDYLIPMAAAIWSTPPGRVAEYPAGAFLRFLRNHGLLTVSNQPQWLTVKGGSQTYVRAFRDRFPGRIVTGEPVRAIRRTDEGVKVCTITAEEQFDHAVIATHADEALAALVDPTAEERRLLGPWRYHMNRVELHTDEAAMPRRRGAWASWNYIRTPPNGSPSPVCLTYWMNRLQSLQTVSNYCVTVNRRFPIADSRVIEAMDYTHPHYDFESLATQPSLPQLNGRNRTWFCGSYFGYGFHEDAVRSAVAVAAGFGCDL